MANLARPSPTDPLPASPEEGHRAPQPVPNGFAPIPAPSFYITGRQPLSLRAILLAVIAAVGAGCLVLYVMGRAPANPATHQADTDDPDQVDVIVIGDAGRGAHAPRSGTHISPVHPTILVHLPRMGDQLGLIPNSPAGHLLYDWLAAFNQASYPALMKALPNAEGGAATAAQLELRKQTGGLSLLSAKEVEPGILVFRLRDQTPAATEVLGTLQMRPNSSPPTIASFSLQTVVSPRQVSPRSTAMSRALPASDSIYDISFASAER